MPPFSGNPEPCSHSLWFLWAQTEVLWIQHAENIRNVFWEIQLDVSWVYIWNLHLHDMACGHKVNSVVHDLFKKKNTHKLSLLAYYRPAIVLENRYTSGKIYAKLTEEIIFYFLIEIHAIMQKFRKKLLKSKFRNQVTYSFIIQGQPLLTSCQIHALSVLIDFLHMYIYIHIHIFFFCCPFLLF